MKRTLRFAMLASIAVAGCVGRPAEHVVGAPAGKLSASETVLEDTTPKAELRMVPPEVYMRTYLQLFGGLLPNAVQLKARGAEGNNIFDTWDDYVSALGFPDYRLDIPRQTQTNALMIASFERLGVALCDRAVERDLPMLGRIPPRPAPPLPLASHAPAPALSASHAPPLASHAPPPAPLASHAPPGLSPPGGGMAAMGGPMATHSAVPVPPPPPAPPAVPILLPVKDRVVFAFEPVTGPMNEAQFAERFDVLHRTFLGYPAALAPPEREPRYLALYREIAAAHAKELPKSKFTPDQAAWAAVCYGLVRHPEFQLY